MTYFPRKDSLLTLGFSSMKYNKFSFIISSTNAAFKVEPKTVDFFSLNGLIKSANF